MKVVDFNINNAKDFIGKKLYTSYSGYAGQDGEDEFILGEVISKWNLAGREMMEGEKWKGKTRQEYWESYMTPSQIKEMKRVFVLLTEEGRNTYIFCDTLIDTEFCCSDLDRYVTFKIDD
ncbi:hypothetical protein [uncultured Capnocytophaga sp.]|uniref:hypothetical protein n=1 Tax=uncultured Capnocytophaga sp. TaxID=159273 RepID=UPI002595F77A|nr:hypothetical protein [uncultured Capnocytophaga sp.]